MICTGTRSTSINPHGTVGLALKSASLSTTVTRRLPLPRVAFDEETDQRRLAGVVEIQQIAVEVEVPVPADLDRGVRRLVG